MKKTLLFALLLLLGGLARAQAPTSITREQSQYYQSFDFQTESQWDALRAESMRPPTRGLADDCQLQKVVFGWHPYWMGTAYHNYDYSLLTDIAYFSYEVNPSTGSYNNIRDWRTTPLVDSAHKHGVRVSLAVTLFSSHATFFGSQQARRTLIDSLVSLVKSRDAKGVNIDFEAVPGGQRDSLTRFMQDLSAQLRQEVEDSYLSIAVPAVDWSNTFDVMAMKDHVDLFIIMGYDYHWSGAPNAGPVSPKNNGQLWSPYDLTRSTDYYLNKGLPPEQLGLGIPYYGYSWPTNGPGLNATTRGQGSAVTFTNAVSNAAAYGREWEAHASVPYYRYESGGQWTQAWYDDAQSLGLKYDMVKMKRLAGIGIWALGYDGSQTALWDLLREKFTDCGDQTCRGVFTDMGGPHGNYFHNEDYSFTIRPASADSLTVWFEEFHVELDYDTLFVHDGLDTQAPLLASLTGEHDSVVLVGRSGALTFRFQSDGATSEAGWLAHWACEGATVSTRSPVLQGLAVFPNPFGDRLELRADVGLFPQGGQMLLRDLSGRVLARRPIAPGEIPRLEGLGHLPAGVYLFSVEIGQSVWTMPVVKP